MTADNVIIVGAGPGGSAAALKLAKLGVSCTLIDKAVFPRDKICGDGLTPKTGMLLRRLDVNLIEKFSSSHIQKEIETIRLVSPGNKEVYLPLKKKPTGEAGSYASRRMDFDNFLVEEAKQNPLIKVVEGVAIEKYTLTNDGYTISDKSEKNIFKAKLLLIADGAHSYFMRHVAGIEVEPADHAAAIRLYYKNVSPPNAANASIEIIFLKELPLGYFWIFPLPDGNYNVGLGMRSKEVSKYKVNLKKEIQKLIAEHPLIKHRFKNAEALDAPSGFGLPLGGGRKKVKVSGAHYMLIGDAGCMVDPFTGEGVGNAIHAGMMAAEQAAKCIKEQNFSAEFLQAYDARIHRVLVKDMKLSKRAQETLKYPQLFNLSFNLLCKYKPFHTLITAALNGDDYMALLKKPGFYFGR